jgi:5'-nucleotidase
VIPTQWRRAGRLLAAPTLIVALVALTPLARPSAELGSVDAAWTPMTPVSVNFNHPDTTSTVTANLLAYNDFHGNIDPPTGSGGTINGVPAGGAEYLAYWIKKLRAEQVADKVITVAAGDNVGATPLVSAAFHDEPTIEIENSFGLDLSSVGNHEFDEGVDELKRLQFGGCHPVDGCQDGDGFAGADFPFLAANVTDKTTKLPILLPFTIEFVNGVPVAFVGMTLEGTPSIVNPAGIATVDFRDEVQTANFYAKLLGIIGIRALVLVIHEGGAQATPPSPIDPSSCANFAGAITPIVAGLAPEYGVVVSGHTHQWYSCALPNSSGANSVVTSAGSAGRLVTEISTTIDRRTRRFVSASAQNTIVENGVRNPDGTWQIGPGGIPVRDPAKVDPEAKAIADKYRTAVAPIANAIVGTVSADITQGANAAGESSMGDVIADAQLAYTASAGAQIALMNPGGIRASITYNNSPGGELPGQVTYGECFTVQPFNNLVVTQTFTGAQLKAVLEQQFVGGGTPPQAVQRILQISNGFTFSYDLTQPANSRITAMALNRVPIDPATTYRVTTNDFLANGGDGFIGLTLGTDRVTAPGFDVDALVAYLGGPTAPIGPGPQNRITKVA